MSHRLVLYSLLDNLEAKSVFSIVSVQKNLYES